MYTSVLLLMTLHLSSFKFSIYLNGPCYIEQFFSMTHIERYPAYPYVIIQAKEMVLSSLVILFFHHLLHFVFDFFFYQKFSAPNTLWFLIFGLLFFSPLKSKVSTAAIGKSYSMVSSLGDSWSYVRKETYIILFLWALWEDSKD